MLSSLSTGSASLVLLQVPAVSVGDEVVVDDDDRPQDIRFLQFLIFPGYCHQFCNGKRPRHLVLPNFNRSKVSHSPTHGEAICR
jgi:hypothetical protein